MNVDAANMTVHADNYWTNELAPSPVNITPDGQVIVDLPPDTMFYGEDAFNIPADSVDFIDQPAPDFVAQGPEWIETNPDGSVVCDTANFPGADVIEFNQANNTATMPTEFVNEQFHDYLPEEVTIHPDGTMTIQTPQGTQFDADTGTLTFPEGEVHTNEVPAEFQPQINANGEVVITLPQGADFDPNAGTLHFENDLVNQITPDYVEFGTDGETQINMPEGTYYPAGGGAVMPENCAEYFEPEVEGPVNTNTGTSQAA